MEERDLLANRFEEHRPRLRALAYRMLGSPSEADDAVQEAWLRLDRSGSGVENLGGWLTTVVGRVCLNMLRSRGWWRNFSIGVLALPLGLPVVMLGLGILIALHALQTCSRTLRSMAVATMRGKARLRRAYRGGARGVCWPLGWPSCPPRGTRWRSSPA